MKEADYTLKEEVLRFPVYSVGTNGEGKRKREREREREKVIAVDVYRYDEEERLWKPVEFLGERIELVNKLSETRYSYVISTQYLFYARDYDKCKGIIIFFHLIKSWIKYFFCLFLFYIWITEYPSNLDT